MNANFYRAIAVVAVFLAFSFAANAQNAYTDGSAAGLSAAQIKRLSALNAAVAVPTYLPAGFKLKSVDVPAPPARGVIDYSLTFANALSKTFTIQSTNDGIGDMMVKQEATGKNPYFKNEFYAGRDEEGEGYVNVEWIESIKKYQPRTQKIPQYYSLVSDVKAITVQDAVKIMKSLRYLKR